MARLRPTAMTAGLWGTETWAGVGGAEAATGGGSPLLNKRRHFTLYVGGTPSLCEGICSQRAQDGGCLAT